MGEYADDYFKNEVEGEFGFDPGSMYTKKSKNKKPKSPCKLCGKFVTWHGRSHA